MPIVRSAAIFLVFGFIISGIGADSSLRSSFELQVPVQPAPVIVAGKPMLFYELHLTNFAQDAFILQSVQVIDGDTGDEMISLSNDELDRRLYRVGLDTTKIEKRVVASGTRAVVYFELEIGKREIPRLLNHRIEYEIVSTRTSGVVEGAKISVKNEPPITLDPPVRGGPWAAIYEPSWERGHRRVFYAVDGRAHLPGRFAIDWIQLDSDGRFARGNNDQISNWYGYSADVLAVTDAVVAATRDDVPETASVVAHPKHALADAPGNYVALNLGRNRYAFYEHLKPGSIRVKTGERVQSGQVIASLGFTGDSSGPHLHFHVADGNTPLGAEGIPFVLKTFKVLGSYDSLDQFGTKPWKPLVNMEESQRKSELPGPNVVVTFNTSSDL